MAHLLTGERAQDLYCELLCEVPEVARARRLLALAQALVVADEDAEPQVRMIVDTAVDSLRCGRAAFWWRWGRV